MVRISGPTGPSLPGFSDPGACVDDAMPRLRRAARRSALAAGAALWLAFAAPAHALVIGVTEGVTYRATDNQIEDRFVPIADALSKALRQPVSIKVLSSYKSAREALRQQSVDVAFLHPAHLAFEATRPGHWRVDLYALARQRLLAAGLRAEAIHGGGLCTISDAGRFFSHRRDRRSGRLATLVWMAQ